MPVTLLEELDSLEPGVEPVTKLIKELSRVKNYRM